MSKTDRRAKVTPETMEESRKLLELWKARDHPGQAVFGEKYGIGNQSAVGQFLRGEVPLSLKAAKGFAEGLGCRIEDFSQRLAAKAAGYAGVVTAEELSPEAAAIALEIDRLASADRGRVLRLCRGIIDMARDGRDASSG